MTRSRTPRETGDAALQFSLPLFDALRKSDAPPRTPGRRMISLEQRAIEYRLARSTRRTIGFLVDDRGLSITAPRWVSIASIEEALREKAGWIVRKLDEWRVHAERRERMAIRWQDGAALPFLGRSLRMTVQSAARVSVECRGQTLRIGLPSGSASDAMRDAVQKWLHEEARRLFAERIEHFSKLLGTGPKKWTLSSARTRWGSCGPDGAIRLNWRLMHFPQTIVDYVVAHELAHLKELNHSTRFWKVVERLYPDYQKARAWLRRYPDDLTPA